jgi:hypothetical protein
VDDTHGVTQSTGDDAAGPKAAIGRTQELASDDHFNNVNAPATDDEDFIQLKSKTRSKHQILTTDTDDDYKYGDRDPYATHEDGPDYSVRQSLAVDDASSDPDYGSDLDSDFAGEIGWCTIHGLTSAVGQALNGRVGEMKGYDPAKERYMVCLQQGDPPEVWKLVRPANLLLHDHRL